MLKIRKTENVQGHCIKLTYLSLFLHLLLCAYEAQVKYLV